MWSCINFLLGSVFSFRSIYWSFWDNLNDNTIGLTILTFEWNFIASLRIQCACVCFSSNTQILDRNDWLWITLNTEMTVWWVNRHLSKMFQSFQVLHHNLCEKISELIYVEFWSYFTTTSKRRNEKLHFALKKLILGPIGIVIFLMFAFLIWWEMHCNCHDAKKSYQFKK